MKKPLKGIWAIFFTSFLLFATLSYTGAPEIVGYELKTSEIYSELSRKPLLPPAPVPETCIPRKTRPEKVKLDTASKSILFVGDSMLEGLSPRLAAYSKENGHTLNTVIWYSSSTAYWGQCDTLTHFINRFKPDYIFMCLGANELFVRDIKKKRAGYMDNILRQIGDIPYVWIGPPNWKEDTGINSLLEEKVKPGSFFLSKGLKLERADDGVHPTRAAASQWMDQVGKWMKKNSNHPIKMEKPQEKKARPARVVILQPKR